MALDEVAHLAGVGIATVYRQFGDRAGLVRAAFNTYVTEEIEPLALAARAAPDPWQGLTEALSATVRTLGLHRRLLIVARETGAIAVETIERFMGPLREVLAAAQRRGQVRADLVVRDLAAMVVMALITDSPDTPEGANPQRYLALLLAGARPAEEPLPPLGTTGVGSTIAD